MPQFANKYKDLSFSSADTGSDLNRAAEILEDFQACCYISEAENYSEKNTVKKTQKPTAISMRVFVS